MVSVLTGGEHVVTQPFLTFLLLDSPTSTHNSPPPAFLYSAHFPSGETCLCPLPLNKPFLRPWACEQFRNMYGRWKGYLPQGEEGETWVGAVPRRTCCSVIRTIASPRNTICSLFPQALEEDLNQKKREQEMFFRLSEEAETRPTTPNRASKFFPYSSGDAS